MGVGMRRGLAVSGETEHGGRFIVEYKSYSDFRVIFFSLKPPLYSFLGPYRDLLSTVRHLPRRLRLLRATVLSLSSNILFGLMPTKPSLSPPRSRGFRGRALMNIGLVHAVTLAKTPSPPITIIATMQSSCRFDKKEGRRESAVTPTSTPTTNVLTQTELPPVLVTLITADMRWLRPGRRSPKISVQTTATLPSLVTFEQSTPNILDMLILRSSLLAGRPREKAREASRAPHWPKGGNPYSLLASLGRVSV
ncbi:uncharacterized protein BO87DRAFT_400105 [Aspergillus neoniger CBS 115656]|uniref:Uncharacterized protein n=1 Tax=Aspergillus neoniger (strain CBS 115656) TaxID=1448310 RepID=A0A318Y987_ASPNB|nr:hypothetical protein BO87DRAFT_400105 [Aspergillus neoniger CBS 115656]PYH30875.1 hypothetical protein BO87DRAFT_400105 [Aspergillus neoniger CBS 115656]